MSGMSDESGQTKSRRRSKPVSWSLIGSDQSIIELVLLLELNSSTPVVHSRVHFAFSQNFVFLFMKIWGKQFYRLFFQDMPRYRYPSSISYTLNDIFIAFIRHYRERYGSLNNFSKSVQREIHPTEVYLLFTNHCLSIDDFNKTVGSPFTVSRLMILIKQ